MANVNSLRGEERREREEEGGRGEGERGRMEVRDRRRENGRQRGRDVRELLTLTLQQYLGDGEERIPPYWGP